MKTFKQFLNEEDLESVKEILERDCMPYLKATQGKGFLRRGIKGLSKIGSHTALDSEGNEMEYGIKTVRSDRQPLDTTRERHDIIDAWFNDKFGIRARSECVFAGGEAMETSDLKIYGTPCIIFPIGPIEYVWSHYVEDLMVNMRVSSGDKEIDEFKAAVRKWLDEHNYQTTGLDDAVEGRNEIMVKCGSYYAFPVEYSYQLKKALGLA